MAIASKYRPEIDGLRALAVVPVILFHAGFSRLSGGFLGVDIFFVISGFLITGIVWRELEKKDFSIARFYERRARRILPALLVVLGASSALAWALLLPSQLEAYAQSMLASLAFGGNIYFSYSIDYFSPDSTEIPLLHLWSLGVEEQFYIFYPLLLIVVARWKPRVLKPLLALLLVLSLLVAEIGWRSNPTFNFYLLPSRAWELLVGALVALLSPRIRQFCEGRGSRLAGPAALAGLAMIVGSLFWLNEAIPTPSLYLVPAVFGTGLVLAFAAPANLCGKVLSFWPFRIVGLVSYSAYLWHQPIIAFAKLQSFVELGGLFLPVAVGLTFALALLSWRYVEQPFRGAGFVRAPLKVSAAALAAMASVAGVLLLAQSVAPKTLPAYARGERLAGREIVEYADIRHGNQKCRDSFLGTSSILTCHFGISKDTDDVILWGDSYAGVLFGGLDAEAQRRQLSGTAYFLPGCPPILGLSRAASRTCTSDAHRTILNAIVGKKGGAVVLLYGNIVGAASGSGIEIDGQASTAQRVDRKLAEARDALRRSGKRLVLIEQGPRFRERVALFYLRNRGLGRSDTAVVSRADYEKRNAILADATKSLDSVIRTGDFFCDSAVCPTIDRDGHLIVFDHDHVTSLYSQKLAAYLLDRLPRNVR